MSFWRFGSKEKMSDHILSSEHLKEELEQFYKVKIARILMEKLAGDASDRKFFRIRYQEKGSYASWNHFILMVTKPWSPQEELPYINVQKFLKKRGIPVPEIYYYDCEKGYIILEDLGDVTYERRIKSVSRSEQESYYRWAIDLLVQLQYECSDQGKDSCIAFERCFDKDKYMYEFNFFITNLVEKYLKKSINKSQREILERDFLLISETLAAEETCFNHRDFHSRNLMIKEGKLLLVDFQDARMGCFQYDLASLLRDSYISIDNNMVSSKVDYYLRKWNEMGMKGVDRYQFRKMFDYACLQRNIKAAGTFGYLVAVKKLKRYEKYIMPTFVYVKHNLEKYREFKELKEVLGMLIEEIS